ncbi:MFS transporter [Gammaproteobacteria bacterium]|nr:MFS transporter [Gammaproteobacteria bacterium]
MALLKFTERPAYGWIMVAIAFTLSSISFGVLASVGVFLKPLAAEFGWSRGSLSFGYSAITLATAFSGLLWSYIVDRFGSRWVVLFGSVTLGIPLLLLSSMETITEFYLYYFIFGALGHATVTGPLYANVGIWFTKNVGLAIGLTVAGGAFGQGVVPYIVRYLIDKGDWQTAYSTLGTAYLILAIPIALLVRDSPRRKSITTEAAPTQKDGSPFPLSTRVVVLWISFAVIFCCMAMAIPIVHLVPLLTDNGMSPQNAVLVFLFLMLAGVVGRILGGKLADHIGAIQSYACMSILQTSVIFIFPYAENIILIYILGIIFGIAFSGVMVSFLVSVRMMVPGRYLARSMATVSMAGWIGMGLGGWQGGYIFDLTGDYFWSYWSGSIAGGINLVILFFFYQRLKNKSN